MPYTALCHDNHSNALALRQSELEAHLNYVAQIADRVLVAGPLSIEGSTDFNASLFIYAVRTAKLKPVSCCKMTRTSKPAYTAMSCWRLSPLRAAPGSDARLYRAFIARLIAAAQPVC